MKKIYALGLSLAVAGLLIGCGSNDDEIDDVLDETTSRTNLSGAPILITDTQSAENAVASISQTSTENYASSVPSAPARLARAATSGTCDNGGTYSIDGTSATFSNCISNGTTMNGSYNYSYSTTDGLETLTYSTTNFSTVTADTQMIFDFSLKVKSKTNDDYYVYVKIDGTVEFKDSSAKFSSGFDNFIYSVEDKDHASINGKYSINSSVNTCQNGVYDIQTITTLDPTDSNPQTYDAGKIKVNGVEIEFLPGGNATVTYADGSTETINQAATGTCQ
jgi:hypothetical protein